MTGPPRERDPGLQRQMDHAAHELARRLRPWITGMADPDAFAARYIEDLHADGWWPHPRSEKIPTPGRRDPDTARRGAELARKLLRGEDPE